MTSSGLLNRLETMGLVMSLALVAAGVDTVTVKPLRGMFGITGS